MRNVKTAAWFLGPNEVASPLSPYFSFFSLFSLSLCLSVSLYVSLYLSLLFLHLSVSHVQHSAFYVTCFLCYFMFLLHFSYEKSFFSAFDLNNYSKWYKLFENISAVE